jgi:hypothetical protein
MYIIMFRYVQSKNGGGTPHTFVPCRAHDGGEDRVIGPAIDSC